MRLPCCSCFLFFTRSQPSVTNPPYSEDHKERCLTWCRATGLPSLVLLPSYVAGKSYYRQDASDDCYIVPHVPYRFEHPTGKGHEDCPFTGIWFVINGGRLFDTTHQVDGDFEVHRGGPNSLQSATRSVQSGLQKRPNPRQRRKLKRLRASGTTS